jgi:hypothetical protein
VQVRFRQVLGALKIARSLKPPLGQPACRGRFLVASGTAGRPKKQLGSILSDFQKSEIGIARLKTVGFSSVCRTDKSMLEKLGRPTRPPGSVERLREI